MLNSNPPFAGPRLKMTRAQRHVAEIDETIAQYVQQNPCRVVCHAGEEEQRPGRHLWKMHVDQAPPDLRTILGDVVHNLRASLDLMACNLVGLNGGDTAKVYFPMADAPDQLDRQIKGKRFDRASDAAVALLKSIGPYPGGSRCLRALHDLDIMVSGNSFFGAQVEIRDGQGVFDLPASSLNTAGQQFFVRPEFKFPKDSPFPRQSLIPALTILFEETREIIERFAALYGPSAKPS